MIPMSFVLAASELFHETAIFSSQGFSACMVIYNTHLGSLQVPSYLFFRSWTAIFGMSMFSISIFSRYRIRCQGSGVQWCSGFRILTWIENGWFHHQQVAVEDGDIWPFFMV
jgi:hypothetical protein